MSQKVVLEKTVSEQVDNVCDYLADHTSLSKTKIKQAMIRGACRVKCPNEKFKLLRRASKSIPKGSLITLHYDEQILTSDVRTSELIEDNRRYSVWFKPPGVLSQGNEWGDYCSVLRQSELHFQHRRKVFLIHRLDKDASGLMVIAHDKKAASAFSSLFSGRNIQKIYCVRVEGVLAEKAGMIDRPVDGKSAVTHYDVLESGDTSLLRVIIDTGRKHQIRVHMSGLGHPVVGDSLYGTKHSGGLHLAATELAFYCPLQNQQKQFVIARERLCQYWQ